MTMSGTNTGKGSEGGEGFGSQQGGPGVRAKKRWPPPENSLKLTRGGIREKREPTGDIPSTHLGKVL